MNTYDVVVVGRGNAGSVLAARLSQREDLKVLLIGPAGGEPPTGVTPFARGHRSGYQRWVAAGAKEWGFYDLLPYFKRSENVFGRDLILRGRGGPLNVETSGEPSPAMVAVLDGAAEIGERRANDINGGLEEGFGTADVVDDAADAYLKTARGRENLEVVPDALVHRLRVANGRAIGVDYSVGSRVVPVSAGQVVLAAGATGSAQLLMLSGIGPADHLSELGIDVVADVPGVGANLQAHPVARVLHRSTRESSGEVAGLVRSRPELDGPDLRLRFAAATTGGGPAYAIDVSVILPYSRGSVWLADSAPGTPPLVEPNHYSDDRDLAAVVAGLRLARRIAGSDALSGWLDAEESPGPAYGEERELRDYARRTVTSYGKLAGTLAMGDGPLSVVDCALRVHGVDAVRVADSSIMPSIPSADITATVYAIAERAAELILESP
jgi:choline dehydrogenase